MNLINKNWEILVLEKNRVDIFPGKAKMLKNRIDVK